MINCTANHYVRGRYIHQVLCYIYYIMEKDPQPQDQDGLFLANREEVELAWHVMNVTGGCPTAGPIVNTLIDLAPSTSASEEEKGVALCICGEAGTRAKDEIITSANLVMLSFGRTHVAYQAAERLLDLLAPE